MSKQRRTFSAEFKRDAAALVLDQGYSHLEASRSLGVVESVLRRWVRQLSQERHGVSLLCLVFSFVLLLFLVLVVLFCCLVCVKANLKKATALLMSVVFVFL